MKKRLLWGCLPFFLTLSCMAQTEEPLCPRHIETPTYPQIARTAHVSGKVVLALTIDADGNVSGAKVANEDEQFVKLLARGVITNIRLWTFAKPRVAPFTQNITYVFQLDDKLPLAGVHDYPDVTIVTYDLPNRVTVRANNHVIETSGGTQSH
jgi:TonB family protein